MRPGRSQLGASGGAPRARTIAAFAPLTTGPIYTLSSYGLLAPVTFGNPGGASNLTVDAATGIVSATAALTAGQAQTKTGTITGADGAALPFSLTLTGQVSAPAQVGTVTATPGNGQVALAWSAPANGGAAILDYQVEYKPSAGAIWIVHGDGVSASTGATLTGLTNDTSYDFRVSAINSVGTGAASAVVSGVPSLVTLSAPYNRLFIMGPGDSRTAMGGGFSGTYGVGNGLGDGGPGPGTGTGIDGVLATLLNNRIRHGRQKNPGIGGATAAQILAYPRPAKNANNSSGNITGTTLTLTVNGGGDNGAVGMLVTGTNVLPNTYVTAGSGAGPFTVNNDHGGGTGAMTDIKFYYVYTGASTDSGKTIADIAAHEAAIVIIWCGTNGGGSAGEITAIDAAIQGLTNPAYSYPGYSGPLPLYGGQPKTVILLNEMRRGITALNAANQGVSAGAGATQWNSFATTLLRYSYDSGNATYANPHVVVVDTFNAPTIADLTDTTTYNPKPGYWADGLHQAMTAVGAVGQIIANRVAPLIDTSVDYSRLPLVSTAGNFYNQNGLFVTQTGGTISVGSHTTNGSGSNLPSGWQFTSNGTSGLTINFSYVALGGDLGNKLVVNITGTASADTTFNMINTANTTQRNNVALATDTLRASLRTKLTITSGSIYLNSYTLSLQNGSLANQYSSEVGLSGVAAGYGNNASYPMFLENAYASAEHTTEWTEVTHNVSLKEYVGSGNPTTIQLTGKLGIKGGVATDITIELSQVGIAKVTD